MQSGPLATTCFVSPAWEIRDGAGLGAAPELGPPSLLGTAPCYPLQPQPRVPQGDVWSSPSFLPVPVVFTELHEAASLKLPENFLKVNEDCSVQLRPQDQTILWAIAIASSTVSSWSAWRREVSDSANISPWPTAAIHWLYLNCELCLGKTPLWMAGRC